MILGDSASAHFHIPQNWLRVDKWADIGVEIHQQTFRHLAGLAIDEFDFPQLSWGTGFEDVNNWDIEFRSDNFDMPKMQSIYNYMQENNKGGYQNSE